MEAKARVYDEIRKMQDEVAKTRRVRRAATLLAAAVGAIAVWELVLRSLLSG